MLPARGLSVAVSHQLVERYAGRRKKWKLLSRLGCTGDLYGDLLAHYLASRSAINAAR